MLASEQLDAYCDPDLDLRPRPDRRSLDRISLPHCRNCNGETPSAVSRTDRYLFIQCTRCGMLWSISKPLSCQKLGTEPVGLW